MDKEENAMAAVALVKKAEALEVPGALGANAAAPPAACWPLLEVRDLSLQYGTQMGFAQASFTLFPGEILGIVGESGSGKTSLLRCLSGQLPPSSGDIWYRTAKGERLALPQLTEAQRRRLARTDWGVVHQNPRDGLRMNVSAGANVAEGLLALGAREYRSVRQEAERWLERVEIETSRMDDPPRTFSGGMQQRVQIARNLVTQPRLVFMDEPTGGLDVSVQARLLDLLRRLVTDLGLSVILVTHDLAVTRLLAQRLLVMQRGHIVEAGLTDQVLDDPQHPYTQLLVASILQP